MKFIDRERSRAIGWKRSTETLPVEALAAAPYVGKDGQSRGEALDFCLPRRCADLNLLPEVRSTGLALFAELGIPWHAGVGDGPSNHLLASQVQCVNALAQMVTNPDRLVRAFAGPLGVGQPLEVEPGRFLTFEYIGPTDYFGESPGRARTRGAKCTSVDAAFLHRHIDGFTELVLLEWKYTESYRPRTTERGKTANRRQRYGAALSDLTGPVDATLLNFELMTDEPLYQLVRQQLLARELERHRVLGAERVRVIHLSSPDNGAYQASLSRPEHRLLGATVTEVWNAVLRLRDRFISLDSALFLDPEITSPEYLHRYGDDVIDGEASLREVFLSTKPQTSNRPVTRRTNSMATSTSGPTASNDNSDPASSSSHTRSRPANCGVPPTTCPMTLSGDEALPNRSLWSYSWVA